MPLSDQQQSSRVPKHFLPVSEYQVCAFCMLHRPAKSTCTRSEALLQTYKYNSKALGRNRQYTHNDSDLLQGYTLMEASRQSRTATWRHCTVYESANGFTASLSRILLDRKPSGYQGISGCSYSRNSPRGSFSTPAAVESSSILVICTGMGVGSCAAVKASGICNTSRTSSLSCYSTLRSRSHKVAQALINVLFKESNDA